MARLMILVVLVAIAVGCAVGTGHKAQAEHSVAQVKAEASKQCSKQALYCKR